MLVVGDLTHHHFLYYSCQMREVSLVALFSMSFYLLSSIFYLQFCAKSQSVCPYPHYDDPCAALGIIIGDTAMTSKNKILFNLNVSSGNPANRIKLTALHPKKEWVAVISSSNTFSLWNYRQKMLIKSFSCNTLDDSKNFDIRQMVFFDRHSLPYYSSSPMRTNIIFVSPFRIYLYDYLTDAIKQINEKEIEQKNIRKVPSPISQVCVYSESKLCVSLNDGSFKVLDCKDLYTKNTMTIKNIRGYHSKPITWLTAYCQNANEMPRVITVSAQDGLMACWNVDTLLHTAQVPDPASPSFKFVMQKGKDSNNGEEIISLQYDNSSYRLVTLTESYITIWSTMTGVELRRLKNSKYKEIAFFNHFSAGANSFLLHSNRSQLHLLRLTPSDYETQECLDLRTVLKEGDNAVALIKTLPQYAAQIFVCTQGSLVAYELDKFYRPSFGFHQNFVTKLTTLNSKEFVIRSEGCLKADIKAESVAKISFEEDILFNSFFLSFEAGWITFNLIEIQYENMLLEQRRYKMKRVAESSPLARASHSQSIITLRFDGNEFAIFNRDLAYYEVFGIQENNSDMLLNINEQNSHSLDFYSQLKFIEGGHARDFVWHQYKKQFAAVKGFDKSGKLVEYVSEKKGLLGRGEYVSKLAAQVLTWRLCIYQRSQNSSKYEIVMKSEPLNTKLFRVYNFGFLFGYSHDLNGSQTIAFLNDEKTSNKEIQGAPFWPERLFVSYCQSFEILVYDGYFVIYKLDQGGQLSYFRSVQQTIIEGMFWEKFFFFATKNSLFFLQITPPDILLIKIADSMCTQRQKDISFEHDDLQQHEERMPQGQLQLLTIVNMQLMMLNHAGQVLLLNLRNYPYIQFCVEVVLGNLEGLYRIYQSCSPQIQRSMKETLNSYGIILQELS